MGFDQNLTVKFLKDTSYTWNSVSIQPICWGSEQSHNRTYKAHPFDFNTDIFHSTLQKDPDTVVARGSRGSRGYSLLGDRAIPATPGNDKCVHFSVNSVSITYYVISRKCLA